MTGTRVILDFQLRLRNGSGRIVTAPCSDNAMLITQCSHCCISFATGLETSTWLFPPCDKWIIQSFQSVAVPVFRITRKVSLVDFNDLFLVMLAMTIAQVI